MRFYRTSEGLASERDFTVVEYGVAESGEQVPRRPGECRCRGTDGRGCRLVVNHWRVRPTLSLGRVLVLECEVHGGAFTVYPITLAPYLRAPTASATPAGREVKQASGDSGRVSVEGTLFEAAASVQDGQRCFSREPENREGPTASLEGPLRWRSGLVRPLDRAVRLLGLEPELTDAERVERAALLGVEALSLKQASLKASLAGLPERGAAVCEILEGMPRIAGGAPGCRLERLLLAGHQAGLWGCPWIWESAAGGWRPFRSEKALFSKGGPGRQRGLGTASGPPTSWVGDGPEAPV